MMTGLTGWRLPLLAICALICFSASGSARAAARPNIIVIVASDLGYADVSAYVHGRIPTPNLLPVEPLVSHRPKLWPSAIRCFSFCAFRAPMEARWWAR